MKGGENPEMTPRSDKVTRSDDLVSGQAGCEAMGEFRK